MKKVSFRAIAAYSKRIAKQLANIRSYRYLHLILKGFTPDKGYLYDFKKYETTKFVKDTSRYFIHVKINSAFQGLFRDKFVTGLWLEKYIDKVAPVSGIVNKGVCYPVDNRSLEDVLQSEKKFILKPRMGWGGAGIKVVDVDSTGYLINEKHYIQSEEVFRNYNNYLLVPYIYQHEYSKKIYSASLNTIRLLTCLIKEKVHVIGAIHRFGSKTTGRVDNFSQGGISAKIDLEKGIIVSAYQFNKKNYKKNQIEFHPDTNEKIIGLSIPRWDIILNEMKTLHGSLRYIKYVGWDVALTSDSFMIIEANHVSDVDSFQIHEPLLLNPGTKLFYKSV